MPPERMQIEATAEEICVTKVKYDLGDNVVGDGDGYGGRRRRSISATTTAPWNGDSLRAPSKATILDSAEP